MRMNARIWLLGNESEFQAMITFVPAIGADLKEARKKFISQLKRLGFGFVWVLELAHKPHFHAALTGKPTTDDQRRLGLFEIRQRGAVHIGTTPSPRIAGYLAKNKGKSADPTISFKPWGTNLPKPTGEIVHLTHEHQERLGISPWRLSFTGQEALDHHPF